MVRDLGAYERVMAAVDVEVETKDVLIYIIVEVWNSEIVTSPSLSPYGVLGDCLVSEIPVECLRPLST